jgi:two-component system CitB family sensor kinase
MGVSSVRAWVLDIWLPGSWLPARKPRGRKLATQILASYLTILIFTVLLGFALFTYQQRQQLDLEYRAQALAIARTVAGIPTIRQAMEYGGGGDVVQNVAEQVRRDSGADYVVVIDRDGIRHSHRNPALVGQRIEEPVVALDGHSYTGTNLGSLGPSANGKAPLYGPTGAIVGEVSVGFLERNVSGQLGRQLPGYALYAALALAVGVAASYLLARRLKRSTFGLELHEIASLLSEREAMLHGVREGVVTFDGSGRVSLVNDEARRLLRLPFGVVSRRIEELVPDGRLRDVLSGTITGTDQVVLTDDHCLEVNRMPVNLGGHDLGAVVTLRDRTELEGLLRELDNIRGLTDALRAQGHEFSNRMHTLTGLLELGDREEALRYIADTGGTHAMLLESVRERIASPLVAGLFLAKATVAAERGVELALTDDSYLEGTSGRGQALLTVIGNLVDNAIDAAASGPQPGRVVLDIREDERGIRVQVCDTGPGLPAGAADQIFQDGFTTKTARGELRRGLGLALVRRVVQRCDGELSAVDGAEGAVFTAVLPAEVLPPESLRPGVLPPEVLPAEGRPAPVGSGVTS